MGDGRAVILRGDARSLPLPDESVDLIVTSPPYWALRSYTDGGEHYAGQIGSEATPREYLDALLACTREWMRVLKPGGSLWVNLGDKYSSPGGHTDNGVAARLQGRPNLRKQGRADRTTATFGIPAKSLMLLPERYRIACVDELGLIARAVVVWSKPNGLPESVKDRVRRSHEDWVHLTKSPRYFAAMDEIRVAQQTLGERHEGKSGHREGHPSKGRITERALHVLGRLPGSVWEVPTQPLTVPADLDVEHFAAFPTEWPRRLILGWSPSGICTVCGKGLRPVVDRPGRTGHDNNPFGRDGSRKKSTLDGGQKEWDARMANPDRIIGYACACTPFREPSGNDWPTRQPVREYDLEGWTPPPTRPAVVLDPFGGTGTTALVASVLGRVGISVDLSMDYCRLAQWRTTDPGERARALRVPKPHPVGDGQMSLFDAA